MYTTDEAGPVVRLPPPFLLSCGSFTAAPLIQSRSRAFSCSIILHSVLASLLMLDLPPSKEAPVPELVGYHTVRVLRLTPPPHLRMPPARISAGAGSRDQRPGARSLPAAAAPAASRSQPVQSSGSRRFQVPPDLQIRPAEQTLVQPDLADRPVTKETVSVPEAIAWSPRDPLSPSLIVPAPEVAAKPPDTALSLNLNERNVKIEERRKPVVTSPAQPPISPLLGRTIPVKMVALEEAPQLPGTLPRASPETSAGRLISLADAPLPPAPLVAVPPVRQIAATPPAESGAAGNGADPGRKAGTGRGVDSAVRATPISTPALPEGSAAGNNADSGRKSSTGNRADVAASAPAGREAVRAETQGDKSGSAPSGAAGRTGPGLTRIDRPRDGKPGSVVLGASAADSYPESAGVLACKLFYTVYIQAGTPKNWILQYCLPGVEGNNRTKGSVTALEAPWPFVIMRPAVGSLDGDYTLVHGLVNTKGRFENLALVIPDEGPGKELLDALQQWEFRPAARDGQPAGVEILLIIPHRKD